jgi:hypothetical protein
MKGRFRKASWERMARSTCKALNSAIPGNAVLSLSAEEIRRLKISGRGWLKELKAWLADAKRKEHSQPHPHPVLNRAQNAELRKRLEMMERLERKFPDNHPSPSLVASFDAALSSPISRYYLANVMVDFFLALTRIRAALVLEAAGVSESTGEGMSLVALDKGIDIVRVSYDDFSNTEFPRLQDLLNRYQTPLLALKMEENAWVALLQLDSGPVESRLLLEGIGKKRMLPKDVLGDSGYIDHALAGLSQILPLELLDEMGASPYFRKKVSEVMILLFTYWGAIAGVSGISLGFCWSCGEFYWRQRQGGPTARTCSLACKTALYRARKESRATIPSVFEMLTGRRFGKGATVYPVESIMLSEYGPRPGR